jgi:hypothetical protein
MDQTSVILRETPWMRRLDVTRRTHYWVRHLLVQWPDGHVELEKWERGVRPDGQVYLNLPLRLGGPRIGLSAPA